MGEKTGNFVLLKGMAINMSVLLMVVLVALVVMFLLAGVFKDFVFQRQGLFGLVPGTETVTVTDRDTSEIVTIDCKILTARNPPDEYEYKITFNKVGFDYTSKAKVFPVIGFRGLTAASQPEEVEIPERISFSSLPIRYKLTGVDNTKLTEFYNNQTKETKETVLVGFFKHDEKCLALAKASVSLDRFVDECARKLETATSVVATRKACG
ncbi:MAG: hypothetical protein HYT72_02090 [Candidatus Aenigmarchaeota archaeon]|nr:hypothetical protein [Candidatus Aenigmarchaeota archaeon]